MLIEIPKVDFSSMSLLIILAVYLSYFLFSIFLSDWILKYLKSYSKYTVKKITVMALSLSVIIAIFPTILTVFGINLFFENNHQKYKELVAEIQQEEVLKFKPVKVKIERDNILSENEDFTRKNIVLNTTQVRETSSIYSADELVYAEIEYKLGFKDTTEVYKGYVLIAESEESDTYFSYVEISKELAQKYKLKKGNYIHTIHLSKESKN